MINRNVIIIGSLALLGVGAYIYFKPKASSKVVGDTNLGGKNTETTNPTDNSGQGSLDNTIVQTKDPVTNEPLKNPIVKTLTNTDILAIQKLRDDILSDMNKMPNLKKQSSRNNVQANINLLFGRLQTYGYSLDTNNNLIKIVANDSGEDVYKYNGTKSSAVPKIIKTITLPISRLFR
jgi:hypothetical protein